MTFETLPCPDREGNTYTKATCSHSWTEIKDALVNGIPVYYKHEYENDDSIVFGLTPLIGAMTNNVDYYAIADVGENEALVFTDPTSKVTDNSELACNPK